MFCSRNLGFYLVATPVVHLRAPASLLELMVLAGIWPLATQHPPLEHQIEIMKWIYWKLISEHNTTNFLLTCAAGNANVQPGFQMTTSFASECVWCQRMFATKYICSIHTQFGHIFIHILAFCTRVRHLHWQRKREENQALGILETFIIEACQV